MEEFQYIQDLIDQRLRRAAADGCIALATRASLRTLPLLIFYSETPYQIPFSLEPFGYWPRANRKTHLLRLMQVQCLSIFLTHRRLASNDLLANQQPLFNSLQNALQQVRSDSERAVEIATEQSRSFNSEARGNAFVTSSSLVYKILEGLCSILDSLEQKRWLTQCSTKTVENLEPKVTEAARLCSAAAVAARQLAAEDNVFDEGFGLDSIEFAAGTLERLAEDFAAVAKGQQRHAMAKSAVRTLQSSYEMLQQHLPDVSNIFAAAVSCSDAVAKLFVAHEKCFAVYSGSYFSIAATSGACRADVAAYSSSNTRYIRESYNQSLLADLDFLEEFSPGELLAQPLWRLQPESADSHGAAQTERQAALAGIVHWQELWSLFNSQLLQLDPDFKVWLDWYEDLFAGGPLDSERLEILLKRAAEVFPLQAGEDYEALV